MKRLRDLPGITDIEKRASEAWAQPKLSDWADAEDLCLELFGLTSDMALHMAETAEIAGPPSPPDAFYDDPRWREVLAILHAADEDARQAAVEPFHRMGWDVSAKDGSPMASLWCFALPLAVSTIGLVGKPTDAPDGAADALEWGSALEQEARRFRSQRRS